MAATVALPLTARREKEATAGTTVGRGVPRCRGLCRRGRDVAMVDLLATIVTPVTTGYIGRIR
jgi:hypothetical protein